jgi:photosystem II stability/assembly factor-like uncharacterized protein
VSTADAGWRAAPLPAGAAPPRALVAERRPGALYLLGWTGLFHTDDAGATWSSVAVNLPGAITQLLVSPMATGSLLAVAGGEVWFSSDGGQSWEPREVGLPRGRVEALTFSARRPASLRAGGDDRVVASEDAGQTWTSLGQPLPEPDTHIHEMAASLDGDPRQMPLSTDRGLYMTRDGGLTWDLLVDSLPGHIEAGPLLADGQQPTTLYAGFSVTPHDELWQNAASGGSALERLTASEVLGAAAFLVLLGLLAGLALRLLARQSSRGGISRGLAG